MASKRSISQLSPSLSVSFQPAKRMEVDHEVIQRMLQDMKEDILKGQAVAVSSIREEIRQIVRDEADKVRTDFDGNLSQLSEQVALNTSRFEDLIRRVEFLETENQILKNCQVDSENRDKRSNLVLVGVPESVADQDLKAFFHELCKDKFQMDKSVAIDRIHRVGVKGGRPRNVVIKFHAYTDRELVWERRQNLKGLKLWLDEHFAVEVQVRCRQLLPFLQAACRRGERCFLNIDQLIINGQRFSTSTRDLRSLELRYGDVVKAGCEREVSTANGQTVLGFYGKFSLFSNFSTVEFEVNGQKFPTVEHFYSYKKCDLNGKKDLAFRVLKTTQLVEMIAISKGNILDDETRVEVVKSGLLAKFHQNPELKEHLLKTGQKVLAEANPHDNFWGTGCALHSEKLAKPGEWPGQNKLGILLMDLRDELGKM